MKEATVEFGIAQTGMAAFRYDSKNDPQELMDIIQDLACAVAHSSLIVLLTPKKIIYPHF